jgi:hypothetical protein
MLGSSIPSLATLAHPSSPRISSSISLEPQRGDFVRVRSRRWLVEDEPAIDGLRALRLAWFDDDAQGEMAEVLWEAAPTASPTAPAIRAAQAAGAKTLRQIAGALNGRGIGTARGGKWAPQAVANVLRRIG